MADLHALANHLHMQITSPNKTANSKQVSNNKTPPHYCMVMLVGNVRE